MSEEKKRNRVAPAATGVVALALLFGLWRGGNGIGLVDNGTGEGSANEEAPVVENNSEEEAASNIITVKIEEDVVTVNGTVCEDAEALKAVVEQINADDKVFKLEENNSIKYTHDWVVQAFEELEIPMLILDE
ncbi:MAG: hypothetical protein IKR11_08185 [Solobacterium sp.]|nr:hypothetical protein [Solobacterium sp.]